MAMAPQVEKLLAQAGARYQALPATRSVHIGHLTAARPAHAVYFEAGDHESLVRMSGGDFMRILGAAPRIDFAVAERPATRSPLARE